MEATSKTDLARIFEELPDPRKLHLIRYPLASAVIIDLGDSHHGGDMRLRKLAGDRPLGEISGRVAQDIFRFAQPHSIS